MYLKYGLPDCCDFQSNSSVLHVSLPSPLLPIRKSSGSSPSMDSTLPPSQRASSSDVEWLPHNYTNVEFAIENAHGRTGRSVSPRKRIPERSLLQHIHAREPIRYSSRSATLPQPVKQVCTEIIIVGTEC